MHKAEKIGLDNAIKTIMSNPTIGSLKTGDLSGIQVFKYKHNTQLYLLAYSYVEDKMILMFIEQGAHENFYRGLQ